MIKLQASGPAEAARAIRKKLKYGNLHRQLRALTLLDGLIQNAGPRFQRAFADEPLLERLRVCGTSDLSDPDLKKKCTELFRNWAVDYKNTQGLERISRLYKVCAVSCRMPSGDVTDTPQELPRRKQVVTQEKSKAVRETENPFGDEDDEEAKEQSPPPAQPAQPAQMPYGQASGTVQSFSHVKAPSNSGSFFSSSSKDKKKKDKKGKKHRPFNLEAEKETMKSTVAESSIATTNLLNTLQSINREKERISENPQAVQRFEACKQLRRKILRYVSVKQWV